MRTLPLLLLLACTAEPELTRLPGTAVAFDFDAASVGGDAFYRAPWPADVRLVDGSPPLNLLPGLDGAAAVQRVGDAALDQRGFPTLPVGWMSFDGPLESRALDEVLEASADAPIQLVDIDPDSPQRGRRVPVVATLLQLDRYVTEPFVLAMAPVPGFVLREGTTHALLVRRDLGDLDGELLGTPRLVRELLHGQAPAGAEALARDAAPLAALLQEEGSDPDDFAAFTVFTTGDVVTELYELTEAAREAHAPTLRDLELYADSVTRPGYCELRGTLRMPQFQVGLPPWSEDGSIGVGADGAPVAQYDEDVAVVITVPAAPMPEGGYPLAMYFHGSGGRADQLVSRGPSPAPDGGSSYGWGPAWVLAEHGFAGAGSAHPVSPDRVEGASAFAYLNPSNLVVFRDIFRQGVIEQRLYLDALLELELDPQQLAGCEGPSLPDGVSAYHFDPNTIAAMGQSMGGLYANLVAAVEPRIGAVVPTGAGGHWSRMGLETGLFGSGGVSSLIGALLRTEQTLSFVHPAMQLVQTTWAPAEPLNYLPRLARRPLPGHPARAVYQPVGANDRFFPAEVFDEMALAGGYAQAGEEIWPSMQRQLALDGRAGLQDYPIELNRTSEDGRPWTGVVVQYPADETGEGHDIFVQRPDVRSQYGCFLATWAATGTATVVDGALGCAP